MKQPNSRPARCPTGSHPAVCAPAGRPTTETPARKMSRRDVARRPPPALLVQRAGTLEVDDSGSRSPAGEQRIADPCGPLLPGVEGDGEPLVRQNAVRTARHELAAPGALTCARIGDDELHLDIGDVLVIRALDQRSVGCHADLLPGGTRGDGSGKTATGSGSWYSQWYSRGPGFARKTQPPGRNPPARRAWKGHRGRPISPWLAQAGDR